MDIASDAKPADLIEATIAEMRGLLMHRTLEAAIDLGSLVVDRLYGGDFDRIGAPDAPSLRALAEHPELPVSQTTLYHAVRVAELVQQIPEAMWLGLSITHLRAVLPLPVAERRALLLQASGEGWTTKQLEAAVRALNPPGPGGRPRLPRVLKTVNQLRKVARQEGSWGDTEALAAMTPAQRSALLASIHTVERRLLALRAKLTPLPTPEDES